MGEKEVMQKRKALTPKLREAVYYKYDGHCAYCGKQLTIKEYQVDHLIPVQRAQFGKYTEEQLERFENYMPACRVCNHYKRAHSLETFRRYIEEIPTKLDRDSYIYRIGKKYNLIEESSHKIEFYFEKVEREKFELQVGRDPSLMQNIKEYTEARKAVLREQLIEKNLKAVIVQVGNVEASNRYVRNKIKDLEEVGITTELIKFAEDITERQLLHTMADLNGDSSVTGYLVQLPLPKHISEEKVNLAIDPKKDIDGFHPLSKTVAATPLGTFNYLKSMNYDFSGKNAVIIGRSHIVGRPMHKLLLDANMNVTILHTKTSEEDKRFYLANADLIVVAAGKAGVVDSSYHLKESAVIMDVGINFNAEGKLIGDCEPGLDVAFQSPVPGGCGLLTRLAVIENLISLAE